MLPDAKQRLKSNSKSQTVTPSVLSRKVFGFNSDFFRMEPKSFRLHRTEATNNHIKQDDPILFTRNSLGVADNQLAAMLTTALHKSPLRKKTPKYQTDLLM